MTAPWNASPAAGLPEAGDGARLRHSARLARGALLFRPLELAAQLLQLGGFHDLAELREHLALFLFLGVMLHALHQLFELLAELLVVGSQLADLLKQGLHPVMLLERFTNHVFKLLV